MQTTLAPEYQDTPDGMAAKAILGKCVHCGFCTATCPTYQLLGDELDGPRGRIYLIKQVLEGEAPTRKTQQHLDRCLTCRNCESTCPSGVQYGHLVDIGRKIVDRKVARPLSERLVRGALRHGLNSPLFAPAMKLGQAVRGLLPKALQAKVPARQAVRALPSRTHARKIIMLAGCVQPAMLPNINVATARVLDAAGIQTLVVSTATCCGAIHFHLNDQAAAKTQMRANIDAWWPAIESGAEHIVMNASGCGVMVKDYGHVLADDPAYAAKAKRIAELTVDLSELLPNMLPEFVKQLTSVRAEPVEASTRQPFDKLRANGGLPRLAYHPPCTLQHGQKLKGGVEKYLRELGFDVQVAPLESHLCCGSAGTYSVLNPDIASTLRDRKLEALPEADVIISANVGCITHLQSGSHIPVRHWIEVLDDAMTSGEKS
ncbi:MAG: glycolate oxidase subunit GlcF [Cytophagales bacterium]|nr:glycolate oxidase subunit GlcF [Cytophagales bacterium]